MCLFVWGLYFGLVCFLNEDNSRKENQNETTSALLCHFPFVLCSALEKSLLDISKGGELRREFLHFGEERKTATWAETAIRVAVTMGN